MRSQRRSSEPASCENGSRPVRGSPSRSEDPKAWRSESAARLGRAKNGSRGPVTKIHREMGGGDFCLSSSVYAKFCHPGLPISEDECFFPSWHKESRSHMGVSSPTFREKRRSECPACSCCFSVFFQFSCFVMSDSLGPQGLLHARFRCPAQIILI